MAAKRTKKKKITLAEFKTWLAGVQSMQPDDWHPSKENWAMILDQIDNITETVVEKVVQAEPDRSVAAPAPHYDSGVTDPRNPAYAAMNQPHPQMQSTLLELPSQPMAPPHVDQRPTPPAGKTTGDNGAISLNISDTEGGYESSLA